MSQSTLDDLAKLLLRIALGVLILLHGWAKLRNGIGGIEAMLAVRGIPTFVAWGVYIGEVVSPLLLILGFYTRLAAAVIAVNMMVAVFLAHSAHFSMLTQSGGWRLELQAMFFVAALALALVGAGRYALGGRSDRWN